MKICGFFFHNESIKNLIFPLLFNYPSFIHSQIGDENLSVFQFAVKFGLTDWLELIHKIGRYNIVELAKEPTGLGVDSYYLAQMYAPYLIPFLKAEYEEIDHIIIFGLYSPYCQSAPKYSVTIKIQGIQGLIRNFFSKK